MRRIKVRSVLLVFFYLSRLTISLSVVNQNAIIREFVTYELLGFIPVGFEKVKEAACGTL